VSKHLFGETFDGNTSVDTLNIIQGVIAKAGRTVLLDANLGILSAALLKPVLKNEKPFQLINTYQRTDLAPVEIYHQEDAVLVKLEAALADPARQGQPIYVPCSSREKTQVLAETYRGKGQRVLEIHGGNSQTAETQAALTNINEAVQAVDLLIASPTIASGVDIQTPFYAVFGIYGQSAHLTAEEIHQQIGRARHVNTAIHLYHPRQLQIGQLRTDMTDLEIREKETYLSRYRQLMPFDAAADLSNFQLSTLQQRHLELWSVSQAKDNRLRNTPLTSLIDVLTIAGHTVTCHEKITPTPEMKELRQERQQIRERLRETYKNAVLEAIAISEEKYRAHAHRKTITPQIEAGYARWQIEELFRQPITPVIYEEHHEQGSAVRRVAWLLTADEDLSIKDVIEQPQAITSHINRLLVKQLCLGLLSVALHLEEGQIVSAEDLAQITFTTEDLAEFFALAQERTVARDIQRLLGINPSVYKRPAGLLRAILAQLGLSLISEKIQHERTRQQYYLLDLERLQTMFEYAQVRVQSEYLAMPHNGEKLEVSKIFFNRVRVKPNRDSRVLQEQSGRDK
jgi:hypothetical protein